MVTLSVLSSCTDVRTEYSETLHEDAVVVTLIYSPSEHRTEITRTAYDNNGIFDDDEDDDFGLFNSVRTGTDYDGNEGIKISKNRQITSTTIPERHGVFQCSHSTFTIEGTKPKYKVLYSKLYNSIRDTVDILYREEYRVTYEKKEGSDEKVQTQKILSKLDFIDAQIKK